MTMTVTLIMIFIDTSLPFVSNQIFISKPHFLGASGDGLNVTMTPADPTLHDSVVDIEPVRCSVVVIRCVGIFPPNGFCRFRVLVVSCAVQNTGRVFQVAERLQGNLYVNNETFSFENKTYAWYPKLKPTYLPFFWCVHLDLRATSR